MIAISLLRPYPNSDIHAAVSANLQIIAARPAIWWAFIVAVGAGVLAVVLFCIRAFNLFNQEVAPPALLAGGATDTACRDVAWPSGPAAANIMPYRKSMMTGRLQIRIRVEQFPW